MPTDEVTDSRSPGREKWRPWKKGVGFGATLGFSLALLALLISGGLSYFNINRIVRNEALVVHTHEVLDELAGILEGLSEAESNQRNYLVTLDTTYLGPQRAAVGRALAHLEQLKAIISDNPAQQERLKKLAPLVQDRLGSLETGIQIREGQGMEGARNYVVRGKGRNAMNAIRHLMGEMQGIERQLLTKREAESRISYRTAVLTQWVTTLLGVGLVVAAYWLAKRELETRHGGAEALARANEVLEQKVIERTADLESANESLRLSNSELEQFASVASHDLQEPLRKIQAFGDRLQRRCAQEMGEQGRDYLARMLVSATRMRSLIDALLTFSRITTKAQPFTTVDLMETAAGVVSDLEARIERMNGRVELGQLPSLEADPLQMRQLLQNLIGNGLKFAREDTPPVVKVESRMLEPAGDDGKDAQCEITVRDNGIGFEEVYLDRIFELFQRLHGRQEFEGTGMGLAICRKIVLRHGGTITARSAPDRGATFLVTLPLQQS